MFSDRDERALQAAAENRVCEPLRIGAALASVRDALTRRPRPLGQERESVTCQPPSALKATPAPIHR